MVTRHPVHVFHSTPPLVHAFLARIRDPSRFAAAKCPFCAAMSFLSRTNSTSRLFLGRVYEPGIISCRRNHRDDSRLLRRRERRPALRRCHTPKPSRGLFLLLRGLLRQFGCSCSLLGVARGRRRVEGSLTVDDAAGGGEGRSEQPSGQLDAAMHRHKYRSNSWGDDQGAARGRHESGEEVEEARTGEEAE